jgi:murein DD-endopeptidase MepM/ murein hydrolase activator NlpD
MSARSAASCAAAICLAWSSGLAQSAPSYRPAGDLEAGSGQGYTDDRVFLPRMRFPLDQAPAYANSQVHRPGGQAGGDQCSAVNYAYPWRDDFCEARSWSVPLCPSGKGHQGQDIRPSTCQKNTYWAVAADDGVVANIGSYSVSIQGNDGTIYRYLHLQMSDLAVQENDNIRRGDRIGKVSNFFGGTPTTIHLHFDVKAAVSVNGRVRSTYIPPYSSLIASYQKLLAGTP